MGDQEDDETSVLQKALGARLSRLREAFEMSGLLEHGPTSGAVREDALRQLLVEFVPSEYRTTSGFVIDAAGAISPQFDIVLAPSSRLPSVGLFESQRLVPIEAALATIEVKSRLSRDVEAQLRRQHDTFKDMSPVVVGAPNMLMPHVVVPMYLFAYNAQMSPQAISSLLEGMEWLRGVCIFDGPFFVWNPDRNATIQIGQKDSDIGTLAFLRTILEDIARADELRREAVQKSLPYYLLGPTNEAMEHYVIEEYKAQQA